MRVTFEETGEQREVVSYCRRCFKTEPEKVEFTVVSPDGMAHAGSGDGNTICGIDATSDRWWHLF